MLLLSLQTKHYQETDKIALIVTSQTSLVLCPQLMMKEPQLLKMFHSHLVFLGVLRQCLILAQK